MNKLFSCTLILFLGSFFISCTGDSPKGVAEDYLRAFNNQDYEKAKDYATDDTKKLLDMFISLAALTPDSMKKNIRFEVMSEKIEGDTATVNYRSEGSDKIQSLILKKVDNKWKVAATKDTINELEGAELMESGATNTDSTEIDVEPLDSISE